MRVLRVIGGLDPAFGGPSRSAVNSCIAARRAGVETAVVFPAPPVRPPWVDAAVKRLAAEDITTHVYPLLAHPAYRAARWSLSPALLRGLAREVATCDIVHVHSPWHLTAAGATIVAAARRRPVVMTPHESLTAFDARSSRDPVQLSKRAGRWLYGRLLALTVCASELERRDSVGAIPADRAITIPHPILDERRPPPVVPHEPPPGALRVGFLGRFDPKKNLELLIRALRGLPASVTLAVGGGGAPAYERALHALAAAEGVAGRIRFHGFIADADKPAFFAGIDLLAMPSRYECFGVSAAEALTFGVPVLVTPDTGVAETVRRRGGGLVVPGDVAAVTAAITGLLQTPERLRALRGETPAAAAEFTFARHGEALRLAYERVLRERSEQR